MGDRLAKPDPNLAVKYESAITSCSLLLLAGSLIHLVAGGLSTLWFTSLYVGALASVFSLFSTGILLLLHKYRDEWRKTLRANLYDGVYPPGSTLTSIIFNSAIMLVWYGAAIITIGFHAVLAQGSIPEDVKFLRGPLPTWMESVLVILCTIYATTLVTVQLIQRRITTHEMKKAILSPELEY